MKVLALILSLLILGSMGTPCSDAEEKEQTELAEEHEDHHEEDFCSPFCTCQCCKTQTNHPEPQESKSESQKVILATDFGNHYYSDWVYLEDQPPRQ